MGTPGSKLNTPTQVLLDTAAQVMVPNYQPKPIVLDHGQGARVWDREGKDYIDFGTGISVTSLGHSNPALMAALQEQAGKLWHASNIYYNEPAIRLAEELVDNAAFAERVFYCNSGAEANEAAIKLARKHSSLKYPEHKREIVTFYGGFHGRTLATVTATAQPKYQAGFEPVPGGFVYCNFNNFEEAAQKIGPSTCAVLVEPIQGEGGIQPAVPGFLSHLRQLCDQHDALLMCDEVQTGMGRTGKLYTHQWEEGLQPDVVTLAKALGGGLPIGAMLVGKKAAESLQPGSHGSTFGGNPVVCAVARSMLAQVRDPQLLSHVQAQGQRLLTAIEQLNTELELFTEVRGRGLMLGAVMQQRWQDRAGELSDYCLQHGLLVLIAGANVLRFLPPLNINAAELDDGIKRLESALRAAVKDWAKA